MVAKTQSKSEALLQIRSLETRFGTHVIHHNLDLDVFPGELLVLFGGSGSGKSTLLRSIIGLESPSDGAICFAGEDLLQLPPQGWHKIRQQIGYSFQSGALFDSLTVAENLEYPLRTLTQRSAAERQQAVAEMLAQVGLPGIEKLYPAELSGGMQKRVGMARTLMLDPTLVLYDEPTAGLDPGNTKIIGALMRSLRDKGKSGILVTHDVPTALAVGDRIAYLEGGRIAVTQARAELDSAADDRIAAYINGDIA